MNYVANSRVALPASTEEVRLESSHPTDAFAAIRALAPSIVDRPDAHLALLYVASLRLIERLHRHLLDVIKAEFDRAASPDINSVCALMLFHIGNETMTVSVLQTRSNYLCSNISYNLKKLVNGSYVDRARAPDRRSVLVRLTEKGTEIVSIIDRLYDRHVQQLAEIGALSVEDFSRVGVSLKRLERFLSDQVSYRL